MTGTVIIGNDRHHSVIQAKYRHKYKTLKFKINTKYRLRGTECRQDEIDTVSHQRTDGLYNYGRRSHLIDLYNQMSVRSKSFHGNIQFPITFQIKYQSKNCSYDLPDNGSHRRTGDSHPGHSEIAEDQDRIQNNINYRPGSLRDHGIESLTGSL